MTDSKKIGNYDLDQFTRRVIVDCLLEATAMYWHRRADHFEAARPDDRRVVHSLGYEAGGYLLTKRIVRTGDHHGQASVDDLAARDDRLRTTAQACRNRATMIERGWDE